MDVIRAEETCLSIHAKASAFQQAGNCSAAEKAYRGTLLTYPNEPGILLGLAGVLALQGIVRGCYVDRKGIIAF